MKRKGHSETESERPDGVAGALRLALVVLVLVGFAAVTAVTVQGYLQVDEVELPDLVGMDSEVAYRQLRTLDLEVASHSENVAGAPVNSVITQAPAPGTVVRRGRSISLGVNQPSEAARVPDLIAEDEGAATRRLADLGIAVERVSYVYIDEPAGAVVEQRPAAGQPLDAGSGVSLVVSRGRQAEKSEVPDVSGLSIRAATERLEDAGFRRVELVPTGTSFIRPGVVREQSPEAGDEAPTAGPVSLYYMLSSSDVVRVPELTGQTVQRAQLALRAAGLELGWVNYIEDEEQDEGIVAFRPEGHTLPGTPVTVTVNGVAEGENVALADDRLAAGPGDREERDFPPGLGVTRQPLAADDDELEDGARRVPFRFDPAAYGLPQDQSFEFRLEVSDEEGDRTLIERTLRPGDSVDTLILLYDQAVLQIYINDSLFSAWSP